MAKSKTPKREVKKICWNCEFRTAPAGLLNLRHWCNNPKSERFNGYIYKGETCSKFKTVGAASSGASATLIVTLIDPGEEEK